MSIKNGGYLIFALFVGSLMVVPWLLGFAILVGIVIYLYNFLFPGESNAVTKKPWLPKEEWFKDSDIYYSSKQWAAIRRAKLTQANHTCQECGSKSSLEVHHLTYKRYKKELLSDLKVLCHSCHKSKHKHMQ